MVSNEVVLQTIKRMIATGVDDDTIRITLRGINLTDADIETVLKEAKGISTSSPPLEAEGQEEEYKEEDEGAEDEQESEVVDELKSSSQEQLAHHTTTHGILEAHSEKMDAIHNDINELHEKIDSTPKLSTDAVAKLQALDARMSAVEKEISETKANTIALQEILKKILETDRKTLIELQKK